MKKPVTNHRVYNPWRECDESVTRIWRIVYAPDEYYYISINYQHRHNTRVNVAIVIFEHLSKGKYLYDIMHSYYNVQSKYRINVM